MKKKNLIIVAITLVVVAVCGFFVYQMIQKNAAEQKRKADTVTLESAGYNVASDIVLPKEKFTHTIDGDKYPRFPKIIVEDIAKTYKLELRMIRFGTQKEYDNKLESARKEDGFKEVVADEKTGRLAWFTDDRRAYVTVKIEGNYRYLLAMDVRNKTDFDKTDVQEVLNSVRLNANFKAPTRDFTSNDDEVVKMAKLATKVDDFDIKQEDSSDNTLHISGSNGKAVLNWSGRIGSVKKDLATKIAEDYHVKKGTHVYDQILSINGWNIKHTNSSKDAFGSQLLFYYAEKDGVVISGSMSYTAKAKASFDKFIEMAFKNLSIDKERAQKHNNF